MTTMISISVKPRWRGRRRGGGCRASSADYNRGFAVVPRGRGSAVAPPASGSPCARLAIARRAVVAVAAPLRRGRSLVARAAAAAAGVAVRVRRAAGREPARGRARSRRRRRAARRAARSSRLARWRGVDRAIKAGNYEIAARHHAAAAARQADAGRRHADVADHRRRLDLRRARGALLRREPAIVKTVLGLPRRPPTLRASSGIAGGSPEGWFFPDTYFFAAGSDRRSRCCARGHRLMRARLDAAWARARGGPAAQGSVRGADPRVDRREGDRARRRPAADRVGVRQPAAHRHAAADRSDGDLRHGRALRRQPAQARPRDRHAVQHLHARRPAADADRAAGRRRRSTRCSIRRAPSTSISSRAATARASSRRTSPTTIAPWQNSRRAGADAPLRPRANAVASAARRLSQPHFPGIR